MTESFSWVAPDGSVYPMGTGQGLKLLLGPSGRMMPPIRTVEDQTPFVPGRRLRSVEHDAREIHWPALFQGTGDTGLRTAVRNWVGRFDPSLGNGRLRVTAPDAATRELACIVTDGLDLDESNANPRAGWCKTVLTFHAPWPYWQDTIDTQVTFVAGTPPKWFPFFPLRLGNSSLFGSQTFTVSGEVPTWPVWTVNGPGTALTLRNRTTDRLLAWDGVLGVNESLVIDTRPAELSTAPKTVTRNDGSDDFGNLTGYDMWPLIPGTQSIDVLMSNTGSGSQITCSYRPSYLAA